MNPAKKKRGPPFVLKEPAPLRVTIEVTQLVALERFCKVSGKGKSEAVRLALDVFLTAEEKK